MGLLAISSCAIGLLMCVWGGGVSVIRQYLSAALIDELHLAIVPVLPGSGEHLLGGLNLPKLGYECVERIEGARATHITLRKRA